MVVEIQICTGLQTPMNRYLGSRGERNVGRWADALSAGHGAAAIELCRGSSLGLARESIQMAPFRSNRSRDHPFRAVRLCCWNVPQNMWNPAESHVEVNPCFVGNHVWALTHGALHTEQTTAASSKNTAEPGRPRPAAALGKKRPPSLEC